MNLSDYREPKPHRLRRILWAAINASLFRWLPGHIGWPLRKVLLRLFGARLGRHSYVYASCRIYAPWMLEMGRALLGPRTEVYNRAFVTIGDDSIISQGAFICSASHDISSLMLPPVLSPVTIGNNVWVAANAFIGPGVELGDGVVVGATASVYRSVEPWTVVGGNPARPIKKRVIKNEA